MLDGKTSLASTNGWQTSRTLATATTTERRYTPTASEPGSSASELLIAFCVKRQLYGRFAREIDKVNNLIKQAKTTARLSLRAKSCCVTKRPVSPRRGAEQRAVQASHHEPTARIPARPRAICAAPARFCVLREHRREKRGSGLAFLVTFWAMPKSNSPKGETQQWQTNQLIPASPSTGSGRTAFCASRGLRTGSPLARG